MPSVVLCNDSFVVSARGPVLAGELKPGADDIWILRPNGSLQASRIGSITPTAQPAWRVLTRAGDFILGKEAVVMTGDGPLRGDQVHKRLANGTRVRVDTISPSKLPIQREERYRLSRSVARASLCHLNRTVLRLPHNGTSEEIYAEVEKILTTAKVAWDYSDDERWLTYRFDQDGLLDTDSVDLAAIADPLMSLTAWEIDGACVTSRVRADETALLASLTGALAAAKTPFVVNWVPGFYPVECRVSKFLERPWPVFLDAVAAFRIEAQLSLVELDVGGKAISGTSFIG